MKSSVYKIKSEVWLYPGMAGWHFLGVPKMQSAEIKEKYGARAKGWGSLPVEVTIRRTIWTTSIFPDNKSGTYLLPLKACARKKENIFARDKVFFSIKILV